MVRALADMPAHLAEEAVTRYARSVDEHVRNPQGFMVRRCCRRLGLGCCRCCCRCLLLRGVRRLARQLPLLCVPSWVRIQPALHSHSSNALQCTRLSALQRLHSCSNPLQMGIIKKVLEEDRFGRGGAPAAGGYG